MNARPPQEGIMKPAPPLSTGEARTPDDVDALLRSYFRAEMPDPWPAPPLARALVTSAAPEPAARHSDRSKLALAASVALLIAGTLTVQNRTQPVETPVVPLRIGPGMATRVKLTETLVQPKDQPTELHIRVTEDVPPRK
jgi:hypothetical protein